MIITKKKSEIIIIVSKTLSFFIITCNFSAGPLSDNLLKVDLDIFSTKQCNESYFSNNNPKLQFGILPDSMICAGSFDGEKDSCSVRTMKVVINCIKLNIHC